MCMAVPGVRDVAHFLTWTSPAAERIMYGGDTPYRGQR